MLDDGDGALLDGFLNGQGNGVQLHGVVPGFCAHGIDGGIQQITLGRSNLPDRPVVTADIVTGGELAVGIGGIGVDQLIALVNAILCAGQGAVALGGAGRSIGLGDGHIPLLQDVGKALLSDGVPLDGSGLVVGDDIPGGGVHLFQGVAGADQDILKISDAIAVGDGIFINGVTAEGSAVQMEGNALVQTVLGGLGHGEMAPSEGVAEGHGGRLTVDHGDMLRLLQVVLIIGLLGYHILTGNQIVDLNFAVGTGGHSLVDALTGNAEGDALHNTILGGLDDLHTAKADRNREGILHGVADRLGVADHILDAAIGAVDIVAPGHNAPAHGVVLGCSDGHRLAGGFRCRHDQVIAGNRELDTGLTGRKRELGENAVGIGQSSDVLTAVPLHFHSLAAEAGDIGVGLHTGDHVVVVGEDLLPEGVGVGDDFLHTVILRRNGHMVEISVTLTDDGFPDQKLGRNQMGQAIRILCSLGTPVQADLTDVAILQDATDQQLDGGAVNGAVPIRGIVVPVILATAVVGVTGILMNAGFDAVAGRTVVGAHSTDDGGRGSAGTPAVHVGQAGMAPVTVVIGIAVTGIADEVDIGLLGCCMSRYGADPHQQGQAHRKDKQQRHAFLHGFHFRDPP